MLDTLRDIVSYPVWRLLTISDPFSLYSLAGGFLAAAVHYVLARPRRPVRRLAAFVRSAFPAKVFAHQSSIVDYQMFFLTSFFFATGIAEFFLTGEAVSHAVRHGLTSTFGASAWEGTSNWAITAFTTVGYVVVLDLGYWLAHYAMHRMPVMWEFHKAHHSAEVLTPFTEWRQHPVELLLFPILNALAVGGFYGLVGYAFGDGAHEMTLFHLNIVLLVLMATILHLRHSHLWIPATGWLGYIIQSPAHHQIHHSTEERHFDKNLGLFLSVWDWAFGTLYIPNERERLTFGLGEESHEHHNVFAVYWSPIAKAAKLMLARPSGAGLPPATPRGPSPRPMPPS